MISIIFVLVIVLVCFYLGILYTNMVMLTIGYALGLLLVISLVELMYRYFTIRCQVDVPISMAEAARPVTVILKIQNKGLLSAGKVEVCVESKNIFQDKGKPQWFLISDVPRGESQHPIKMEFQGAGCHEICVTEMKLYSIFGLIYLKRRSKAFGSVIIMPKVYPLMIQLTEAVRNFIGDADVYDDFRAGYDTGETFEIRAYREKDKLQSIHWKLSAKMDELMVKENSMPKACAIVLMLELRQGKKKHASQRNAKEDGYLELVASVSYALMDQKCPHFVAWYSADKEEIRRIRVDDEESFYLFLNAYLRDAKQSGRNVRTEYRTKYKNEWYLTDITVNEALEIYKNGERLTRLNAKKMKDECEKLEILL